MPEKNSKKPIAQIDKFREAARELETDERPEAFDKVLRKVAQPKRKPPDKEGSAKNDRDTQT